MAGAGPLSPAELAERTGTAERYVREWLAAQAAAGYVAYDPASGRFSLPEEQAFALADPAGPVYLPGAFQLALASLKGEPRIAEAFRTGAGVGWHEQDPEVFDGCEMFFAPGYRANLVQSWIPALDGVEAKLQAGRGSPTSAAATAPRPSSWPRPTPTRPSPGSTTTSGRSTGPARPPPRPASPTGSASRSPRPMPSPGTATTWWRPSTASTTWRPRRGGRPHPPRPRRRRHLAAGRAGRRRPPGGQPQPGRAAVHGFSVLLCVPNALSQQPTAVLGNQAGEARTRELTAAGGFTRFRRAAETPSNLVYEVRPSPWTKEHL
jgi:hypothetical protein